MANYLVTGAAGFIGAAVAKKLVEQKHFVVTIDNLSTGFKQNIPEGVNFIEGDCADHSVYKKIPEITERCLWIPKKLNFPKKIKINEPWV